MAREIKSRVRNELGLSCSVGVAYSKTAAKQIIDFAEEELPENKIVTNKEIVTEFIDNVFNAWELNDLNKYMRADYRQHSHGVKDGRDGFREFAAAYHFEATTNRKVRLR